MSDVAGSADSILARTAKGAGWIIGWRMVTRILGLASTLILVRLLLPSDFGLVTLATSFSQAVDSLSALGVDEAVIREKDPDRDLYDSAFTINFLRGLATASVLALGAWPIGWFFGDGRLVPVMLAIAGGAVISGCENIGIVDFRREIAFDKEFLLMSVPRVASVVVAVGLAYALRSYWALIAAILSAVVIRIAMGYVLHPFRPRLGLSAWRRIAGFSFWSWLLALTGLVRDRCDTFVIGRALGITQVGIYSVGSEIALLPASELVSPLARACFSGFASARHNGGETEASRTYIRVLRSAILLALPAGIGLSLVASPVVALAFGARWHGAAPVIEVLGVGLSVMIVGLISASLLNAYGLLRATFRIQLTAVAVRVPVLLVLVAQFGIVGAAIGAVVGTAVEHLLYTRMALNRLGFSFGTLLHHTWKSILATGVMTAMLVALQLGWAPVSGDPSGQAAERLLKAIAVGVATYGGTTALLWYATGRPLGAEMDLFEMARLSIRRATLAMRRQVRLVAQYGSR